jgi:hypothetical protein
VAVIHNVVYDVASTNNKSSILYTRIQCTWCAPALPNGVRYVASMYTVTRGPRNWAVASAHPIP